MFSKKKHKNELAVPPLAAEDSEGIELARIWAAVGKQHVTIATGVWKDPAAWGLMLADLARHIANAYAVSEGRSSSEVLARIRVGLDAEWDNPTDVPAGDLLQPPDPKP